MKCAFALLVKGNMVNIPLSRRGYFLVTICNSEKHAEAPRSVLFSSQQLRPLEADHREIGWNNWSSASFFGASGMQASALENPKDSITLTPGRTHNRIRSPRLAASGR